mmetsp:Transcript_24893/g.54286  ORF Transcript_24893/g.54286 Transcript_24893/m.54286 type:complete len:280 (+) Transcript_24893:2129-2968(+)
MPLRLMRSLSGLASVRPSSRRSVPPTLLRVSSMPRTPASMSWSVPSPTRPRSGMNLFRISRWLARLCRRICSTRSSSTPMPRRTTSRRWNSSLPDRTLPTFRTLVTDASTRACTMQPRSSSPVSTTTLSLLFATSIWRSTARLSLLLPRRTMSLLGRLCASLASGPRSSALLLPAVSRLSNTPTMLTKLFPSTPISATLPTLFRCLSKVLALRMLTLVSLLSLVFFTPSMFLIRSWSIARYSSASSMLEKLSVPARERVCSPLPCTCTWPTSSTTMLSR